MGILLYASLDVSRVGVKNLFLLKNKKYRAGVH